MINENNEKTDQEQQTGIQKVEVKQQQIPFTLIQQLSQIAQIAQYKNENTDSNKQHWVKFNCRGTIIEANPSSLIRSKKIYETISRKEWTPQSVWRLDVRSDDFHVFLDYLCGLNKSAIKNPIVSKLCEEFEVDVDIKKKISEKIDNLIIEIAIHANKNKDAFTLISIPLDKSKTIHNHMLQFLIPSKLIDKYDEYLDEFDELILDSPFLLDEYICIEKELKSIDGMVLPGKFKLIKKDGNYYIEAECEQISRLISEISQIIKCGNFKLLSRTNKFITSISTECPKKWNEYLRNLNSERNFDIFIPEYHWIQRPKPSNYPPVNVPSYIVFNGVSRRVLNFIPDKNRIKGYEYSLYPQVRIVCDRNTGKCEIELCKLEWKIEEFEKKDNIYTKTMSINNAKPYNNNKNVYNNNNNNINNNNSNNNNSVDRINGKDIYAIDDINDNMLNFENNYNNIPDHDRLKAVRLFGLSSINNQKNFKY